MIKIGLLEAVAFFREGLQISLEGQLVDHLEAITCEGELKGVLMRVYNEEGHTIETRIHSSKIESWSLSINEQDIVDLARNHYFLSLSREIAAI